MMLSERFGAPAMASAATVMVGWSVLVACGLTTSGPGGNPGPPFRGCAYYATVVTCNIVEVSITADGPYDVAFNGVTWSPSHPVYYPMWSVYAGNVAPGTYDITGTTGANSLTITLVSITSETGGVVQRGSVTNLVGPAGAVTPCSVSYTVPAGGTLPQAFHARYTLYVGTDKC